MLSQLDHLLPPNRQGLVIDLLAIAANLLLFPIFAGRIDRLFDNAFSNNVPAFATLSVIMLIILSLRLAGLYFKRYSLRTRLGGKNGVNFALSLVIFSVPVFVLTTAFVMTLAQAIVIENLPPSGNPEKFSPDSSTFAYFGVMLMVVLIALEVFLIYRLTRRLDTREKKLRTKGNWRFRPETEYAADFGLFSYMLIWQVFYFQVAEILLTTPDGQRVPIDVLALSLFFLAVCFMLFYVSPRAVFLIEDRKHAATWATISLVFISSVVRHL